MVTGGLLLTVLVLNEGTIVNFFVALAIPRLTPRFGNAALLAAGVALTLAGMAWLSHVQADSSYAAALALPMVIIGAGAGSRLRTHDRGRHQGVTAREAGAASGLVNTAHQLGSALLLAPASSSP